MIIMPACPTAVFLSLPPGQCLDANVCLAASTADIRDLISVDDVMAELGLGPNGALMYCMECVSYGPCRSLLLSVWTDYPHSIYVY